MSTFDNALDAAPGLAIVQRRELAELFGFETRNKYEIRTVTGEPLGFAAEQQKGIIGFLLRQVAGHFRSFEISFFDTMRNPVLVARHPFRWFFQRLEVIDAFGRTLGAIQRRWSWFSKRFDVEDAQGNVQLTVASPLWRPWTFTFMRHGQVVATIRKQWSGALREVFTDADNFGVEFQPGPLHPIERRLLLAAAIFVDLMFFERKAE
ncbi:MAG: phospholipid scramblase-related protein [Polyangiaceae bacterium]